MEVKSTADLKYCVYYAGCHTAHTEEGYDYIPPLAPIPPPLKCTQLYLSVHSGRVSK